MPAVRVRPLQRPEPPSADGRLISFRVVTARDLCATPDPDTDDELLGPLVRRRHRIVIGGHTGEGKSTLTLGMTRAILTGERFLGFDGVGNVRALYIDAEQGLRTVKRRLREARLELDALDYLRVPDGLDLNHSPEEVAAMEDVLERGRYSLVLADPLYKLHRGDSNDEREAVDLMRRLDGWRERYGFALVLPVHCRKPPMRGTFTIHDLFGSSAYLRGAEVVLGLRRIRAGEGRLYFFKDRDGDLPPVGEVWNLSYSAADGYRLVDRGTPDKGSAREVVAALLADHPGSTAAELLALSPYKSRTPINEALKELKAVAEGYPPRYWPREDDA
jgi:hypothetical protein